MALSRPGVLQLASEPRARSVKLVQLQAADQRFRPVFLSGPHARIDLRDVQRGSREGMSVSYQLGKPFAALVPEAENVNQDRGVQEQLHFFACRRFLVRLFSLSCRSSCTQ